MTGETSAANRIRELRKKLGLTAKNLAERIDTTESTISRIESGKQSLTQNWLQKISKALGVSIADLLGGSPGMSANYAPVCGRVAADKWVDNPFYGADQMYSVPLVAISEYSSLTISAFEYTDVSEGWIIAAELSKLVAANYIGKPFVVCRVSRSKQYELSLRVLEHGGQGLYLVLDKGDPSQRAVRLDDDSVSQVWRVLMRYLTY